MSRKELSVGAHPYSKKICLSVTEYLAAGGAVTRILARFDSRAAADEFLEVVNEHRREAGRDSVRD